MKNSLSQGTMVRMLEVESAAPPTGRRLYFRAFFNTSQWKVCRVWLGTQTPNLKASLAIYFNYVQFFRILNNKG